MAHITIKNIGPVHFIDIDLNRINVFMGPQSSGKSTIAKIICHCEWVEKQCYSDFEVQSKWFQTKDNFIDSLAEYHRLEGYINKDSEIHYTGKYIRIYYVRSAAKQITIERNHKKYTYPKIAYLPSERNIVGAIPNIRKYAEKNDVILYFTYDWNTARDCYKSLPLDTILNQKISFKYEDDTEYIYDNKNRILFSNASSGLQSLTPLMMVLQHATNYIYKQNRPLSSIQKRHSDELRYQLQQLADDLRATDNVSDNKVLEEYLGVSLKNQAEINNAYALLDTLYDYHYSKLYIEEPEQNLFPETQIRLLYWLLPLIKKRANNTLTLTTHSPYILFALNNCMMGGLVQENIPKEIRTKEKFRSYQAWIKPKNVSIYQIQDGQLVSIQDEDGIIKDNYLNQAYKENSAEYLSLLNYYNDEE